MVSNSNSSLARPGPADGLLDDPATRAVLDAIRRIVRALRESSRGAERSVGLGAAQLFVLQRLSGAPALSLNELAHRTLTHQSSVSVVVSKLVRSGLVARTRAATDGRRVEIGLTQAGRTLLARAPAAAQDRLIGALGLLGGAARRDLARRLGHLVEAMALPDQPPPMFFEAAPKRGSQAGRRKSRARVG
jgi:MarR family transcriptional regulator, lower aerobic nicotinate degradation pathway regulator